MQVEFDIDNDDHTFLLKFDVVNFKEIRDYKLALGMVICVASDYSIDPEIEIDDLKEIVQKTKEANHTRFIVEIHEDGIEVEV